jgi:hypothetical protein
VQPIIHQSRRGITLTEEYLPQWRAQGTGGGEVGRLQLAP